MAMVSKDLTCDETMPPHDDGESMIAVQMMRTSAFVHQQQSNNLPTQNNLISNVQMLRTNPQNHVISSSNIGPTSSFLTSQSDDIGMNGTTVRDVVTRKMRNSKLNNSMQIGYTKIVGLLPSDVQNSTAVQNHSISKVNNGRASLVNKKSAIVVSDDITRTANYLLANPAPSSMNHPIINCHQLPVGSQIPPVQHGEEQQATQIFSQSANNNHHWAQHVPDSTVLQQPKRGMMTSSRTVLLPEPSNSSNTTVSSSSAYQVVMPPVSDNACESNGDMRSRTPNSQQQQIVTATTSHPSPRPNILRGNGTMRRLAADRDRPASTSSVCEGNGQSRAVNCSSPGGCDETMNGEETPRKKARKQQFEDALPDKLMMEVNNIAAAGPTLNWNGMNPSVSPALSTSGIVPKKRGRRPKMANTRAVIQTYPDTITQAAGMMVEVDRILQIDQSTAKKRTYTKRPPELDPETGEIIKKQRKKGSGRKSKRDLELAAQQQRESAILASAFPGISGFSATTGNNSNFTARTSSAPTEAASNGQHQTQDDSADRLMAQRIEAEEQNGISVLYLLKQYTDERTAASKSALRDMPSTSSAGMSEKLPSLPDEKMPLMPKNSNNNRVAKKKRIAKKPLASPLQPSTSQRNPLPLLPDLVELGEELRPLLRRCEKALNSQDNAHLSESFEEVNKKCEEFLALSAGQKSNNGVSTAYKKTLDGTHQPFEDLCMQVSCPVFDTYAQYKNAMDGLQLLPKICGYFDASKRLLKMLHNNLIGQLLYKHLMRTRFEKDGMGIDQKVDEHLANNMIPLSTFQLEGSEDTKEEATKLLFQSLLEHFEEHKKQYNHLPDGIDGKFLLQLEVAQALNSILDRVQRNQLDCSYTRAGTIEDQWQECKHFELAEEQHSSQLSTNPNVNQGIQGEFMDLLLRKGRRKRMGKLWREEDLDDTGMDCQQQEQTNQLDEDVVDDARKCQSVMERLCALFEHTHDDFARLQQFAQKMVNLRAMIDTDGEQTTANEMQLLQRREWKQNPHKSNQIQLRPPMGLIRQLFKGVIDFDSERNATAQEETNGKQVEGNPVERGDTGEEQAERRQPSSKLLMQDLDELLANSEHISALAEAQIRSKYADKLMDRRFSSPNDVGIGSGRPSVQLFRPALKRKLPSTFEEQKEFIKSRYLELNEMVATTTGLQQNRKSLAMECSACIREIQDNNSSSDGNPGTAMEEDNNREATQSPTVANTKRAAHRRALSNLSLVGRTSSTSARNSVDLDNGMM